MQRRFKAQTLSENAWGTAYPAPREKTLDMSRLSGGLNLWEMDYRLRPDQSPDCLNVYWKDGCLSSRQGQEYTFEQKSTGTQYGAFRACYDREWPEGSGFVIAHKGTKLYKIDRTTGAHTQLLSGLSSTAGNFFVYGDKLYYLGGGKYVQITDAGAASVVTPYTPIVVINRKPDGSGGDLYQPENRIGAGKEVWFTADGTSTDYHLPYTNLDNTTVTVTVNNSVVTTGITVNQTTGVVKISPAPSQSDPAVANNVKITCYKSDSATIHSVLDCKCATVYGTENLQIVVCGGTPAQPNAYFWSGNHSYMDPTYFPADSYNLAGANATEYITGFGEQQAMLIIFQERSIGKTKPQTQTISGRDYINLPYTPVNELIGCNLPHSIQLINNNLVFANTYAGVYCLMDTSSANENNVKHLSRNIDGSGDIKGLLYDARAVAADTVTSYDDNQRYWLVAHGKAYLWDYVLAGYNSKEENLSWFYFDNINARGWFHVVDEKYYFTESGSLSKFIDAFADYTAPDPNDPTQEVGVPFLRKYAFATQFFGTYESLKDVLKVIFAVRSDTNSTMEITYRTDYEYRQDLTPVRAWGWRLVPRNLTYRCLRIVPFAYTAVRKPRCFHVRHFQMILTNNVVYADMSVLQAQIIYRYSREEK